MHSANKFAPVSALSLAALVCGGILLQLAGSALNVLVPLQMALQGQAPAMIGAVASSYAAGFLTGCFVGGTLTRRVGHIRAFAILAATQSCTVLALALFTDATAWLMLRFAGGFAGAGLSIVIESWINGRTPRSYRGRVLAVYNIVNRLAMITGQLWPAFTAASSTVAFIVMGGLYSAALIPVGFTRTRPPKRPDAVKVRLAEIWATSPISLIGCLYVGLVGGALIGMLPAYGVLREMSPSEISILTAMVQIGAMSMQWPLGFVSDRVDRRKVMLGTAAVGMVAAIMLLAFSPLPLYLAYAAFAVIGAACLPIYALAVAHAYDKSARDSAITLSASLLFVWASGSAIGPMLMSFVMQFAGPRGLHAYLVLLSLIFIALVMWRLAKQPAPQHRTPFAAVSQTSPVIGRTDDAAPH
ncbi:MFS transporter [Ferrovibrio sp.]|uniref:MFS transporter n=1 Tax=Ferrovibrio sp. TaxID=1917215 RepID=UPI0025C3C074|nr:MFS transporter [Ferrovibrio sp.]MBX3453004.1 MFS transporter [Ferrovibrio sp.]